MDKKLNYNERIIQKGNKVQNGNIIGKQEIIQMYPDAVPAQGPIREKLSFNPKLDGKNTTLTKKLTDGKTNTHFQQSAKKHKTDTLKLLLDYCQTDEGRRIIEDMYQNLTAIIQAKFISQKDEGELLKSDLKEIYNEFSPLVAKYKDEIEVDEAFFYGLLFIATSNCAIKWKIMDNK